MFFDEKRHDAAAWKGDDRTVDKDPLAFVFYIVGLLVGIAVCIALNGT